jgi:endoglucanase
MDRDNKKNNADEVVELKKREEGVEVGVGAGAQDEPQEPWLIGRRRFAGLLAALAAGGSGGGQGAEVIKDKRRASSTPPAPAPAPAPAPSPAPSGSSMGTNLSGLEWAAPGLRYGLSTAPNINITMPRKADVALLASVGFLKNRLPISWEMLQPTLASTFSAARESSAIGLPGAFHEGYAQMIDFVLDSHAALGAKCIIDLHNYGRYQDFVYQSDGSVRGLVVPSSPELRPYTSDNTQVRVRIVSKAPGATLRVSDLVDFWTRAAKRWASHQGLAGFGLMNEPHDLPGVGSLVESYGGQEDLTIWPLYAQAAVDAIRSVTASAPIYVSGNQWDSAMALSSANPGYPLRGTGLIYEVHMYLDASSSGANFDYDIEVAKGYSAGGSGSIGVDTGVQRLTSAVNWAKANNVGLALTETGMPIDDPRWAEMFSRAVVYARSNGVEVYSWMGGAHWPIRAYPINHVPTWHQGQVALPQVAGPMLGAMGRQAGALFDEGPCVVSPGVSSARSVRFRGYLSSSLTVGLSISGGGSLSSSSVVLPAGFNTSASYQCSCPQNSVCEISFAVGSGAFAPPKPRKIFAGVDPGSLASAGSPLAFDAALAKYSACRWDMKDAYTEVGPGSPCQAGSAIRAVHDSGYGSSLDNPQEMLNWLPVDFPSMSAGISMPKWSNVSGGAMMDLSGSGSVGLWCKKSIPNAQSNPKPKNRVTFSLEDNHFCAVAIQTGYGDGVIFQTGHSEGLYLAELSMVGGRVQARWLDAAGKEVVIASNSGLSAGQKAVVSMGSSGGRQWLRVGAVEQGAAYGNFAASPCSQMLIGWGFVSYYPRGSFGGGVFGALAGKGTVSQGDMAIMEKGLAAMGSIAL